MRIQLKYLTAALMVAGAMQTGFAVESIEFKARQAKFLEDNPKVKAKTESGQSFESAVKDCRKGAEWAQLNRAGLLSMADDDFDPGAALAKKNKALDEAQKKKALEDEAAEQQAKIFLDAQISHFTTVLENPLLLKVFNAEKIRYAQLLKMSEPVIQSDSGALKKIQELTEEIEQIRKSVVPYDQKQMDELFEAADQNVLRIEAQRDDFQNQLKGITIEHGEFKGVVENLGNTHVLKQSHIDLLESQKQAHALELAQKTDPAYKMKVQIDGNAKNLELSIDAALESFKLASKPDVQGDIVQIKAGGLEAKAVGTKVKWLNDEKLLKLLAAAGEAPSATGDLIKDRASNREVLVKFICDNGIVIGNAVKDDVQLFALLSPLVDKIANLDDLNRDKASKAEVQFKLDITDAYQTFAGALDLDTLVFAGKFLKVDVGSNDEATIRGILVEKLKTIQPDETQDIINQLLASN